jgi:hypothetical protein
LETFVVFIGPVSSVGGKPIDNFRLPEGEAPTPKAAHVLDRSFSAESAGKASPEAVQ